jgi:hypothetical protein
MILDREDGDVNYEVERSLAQVILVIDYYEGDGSFKPAYNAAMMKGHLALPKPFGERDILKFYCKRLSCSCLKEKYKQARKTLPKMGRCYHCHKCFERESLMTCSLCKVPLYCSRQCQVAHWPKHRNCSVSINIRKREAQRGK